MQAVPQAPRADNSLAADSPPAMELFLRRLGRFFPSQSRRFVQQGVAAGADVQRQLQIVGQIRLQLGE